jgi:hypothetical protein
MSFKNYDSAAIDILADHIARWYEAADHAGQESFLTERDRRSKTSPQKLATLWPDTPKDAIMEAYARYRWGMAKDHHVTEDGGAQ